MVDTTFITNKGTDTFENHFKAFMKNTKVFSCLVGYFYASGFFRIYKELEDVEEIRVLVGISTNKQTFDMLSAARENQLKLKDSTAEVKKEIENKLIKEYEESNQYINP